MICGYLFKELLSKVKKKVGIWKHLICFKMMLNQW